MQYQPRHLCAWQSNPRSHTGSAIHIRWPSNVKRNKTRHRMCLISFDGLISFEGLISFDHSISFGHLIWFNGVVHLLGAGVGAAHALDARLRCRAPALTTFRHHPPLSGTIHFIQTPSNIVALRQHAVHVGRHIFRHHLIHSATIIYCCIQTPYSTCSQPDIQTPPNT